MRLVMLCLALVLAASARAQVTSAPSRLPSFIAPIPNAAPNCVSVSLSTHSPTQVLAAPASLRTGLFLVNSSTMTMAKVLNAANPDSRPPDEWVLFSNSFGSAGTVGQGPAIIDLAKLPGIRIRGYSGTNSTENGGVESSRLKLDGYGVPQGIIYAVAESTGVAANVQARMTACEFLSQ